jgi:hypothetical protein
MAAKIIPVTPSGRCQKPLLIKSLPCILIFWYRVVSIANFDLTYSKSILYILIYFYIQNRPPQYFIKI